MVDYHLTGVRWIKQMHSSVYNEQMFMNRHIPNNSYMSRTFVTLREWIRCPNCQGWADQVMYPLYMPSGVPTSHFCVSRCLDHCVRVGHTTRAARLVRMCRETENLDAAVVRLFISCSNPIQEMALSYGSMNNTTGDKNDSRVLASRINHANSWLGVQSRGPSYAECKSMAIFRDFRITMHVFGLVL